jgi:hypothetical protein
MKLRAADDAAERDSGARASEVLGSALPKFPDGPMLVGVGLYAHYVGSSSRQGLQRGGRFRPVSTMGLFSTYYLLR